MQLEQTLAPGLETFRGEVLRDGQPGYDEARAIFNGAIDRRPALIARCSGVADVMDAVRYARANELEISVKGGGHSAPGHAVTDGGVMIDMTSMKGVKVDPASRRAHAQAGLTWAELDRETQVHGLAVTGGRISHTGIAGLTLGAGSGWIERKYGFACDNLVSADVVTADGKFVRASADENPDLLWGLRGGGGNFGIVTSFEYQLHPVGPMVLGGMLLWPREVAGELYRLYRDFMADALDEMGGAMAFNTAPPFDFVPEFIRGKPAVGIVVCWIGDLAMGQEYIRPLRDFGQPALDMVQPMPYTVVQQLLDAGNPHGRRQYWKADLVETLTDDAIDTMIEMSNRCPSPFSVTLCQPMGGAIARVDNDATALGNRHCEFAYHAISQWEDPAADEVNIAWARELGEAMEPYHAEGSPVNFSTDQSEEALRQSHGDKYARLVALKDKWDPDNAFHLNQNIRPSSR
jgi:FAD/FMN-containing dehydrogenase